MSDPLEHLTTALTDRYAIEREIGRGGMATVYLAEDLKHHRKVAIKVLLPQLAASLGPERFLQEIDTAAKLNHPHILALHDSGEADGFLYYVMPYVEGESLRERLDRDGQLPLDEALRIAREVADGLGYAHRHDVVHRDIKPGNILLSEGHATIADFGIAKAIAEAGGERVTQTGMSVGSPAYMSPEQVTSDARVDGRSDIYSLGCVLYEMLAGEPVYFGATPQAVFAKKAVDSIPRIRVLRETVPEAVDAAIAKAIAKVPADRFATTQQFIEALESGPSPAPSDTIPARPAMRTRLVIVSVLAGVALTVGAIAIVASRLSPDDGLRIETSGIVQVTNDPGVEFQPALSPDGSEVAFLVGPMSTPKLTVRSAVQIGGGQSILATDLPGLQLFPRWSSETSIRFVLCESLSSVVGTFDTDCSFREMGMRGAALRTIAIPRRSDQYAWSPDGTRVAFFIEDSLYVYEADDPQPRLLSVHGELAWHPHSIVWSPDGSRIAYVNGNFPWLRSGNVADASIWVVDSDGGDPVMVVLPAEPYLDISPQWLPDSRHLLFVSNRDGPRGIYSVEVGADGPVDEVRVVAAGTDAHTISVSADGARLAYSKFIYRQNVWSLPIPETGSVSTREAQPVTTGNQVIEQASVSPDGQWIAYESNRRGNMDLYKRPIDGGEPQLLADFPEDVFGPQWSPDGTEITVFSDDIFVVSADGSARTALVDGPGFDVGPAWSPDGLMIAFHSQGPDATGGESLWAMSRDSVGAPWGEPQELTDFQCIFPDWSPNDEEIVCGAGGVAVIVSPGGELLRRIDFSEFGFVSSFVVSRYSEDGSVLYFGARHEDGSRGIWSMPVGGGAPRLVVVDDPARPRFAFSEHGGRFYFTLSEYESDIYVTDLQY